jgi:sialic acid synthase SpsE
MKILTLVSLTALTLAACDSKQEQLRKAELENHADKLDEAAKATKKAAEGDAAVVKKQGEAQAEALKNAADKTRDQK